MKNIFFTFLFSSLINLFWGQNIEVKDVNDVFVSYINNVGKACEKCKAALQKYPTNQKLINFKKQCCTALSFNIYLVHTNVSFAGGSDGTAKVTASDGTPPYQYYWSNGKSSPRIIDLSPGTYKVTVTDNAGKIKESKVIIEGRSIPPNPRGLNIFLNHTNVSVVGGSDGTAKVTASGGTPPYQYDWSNGEISPQAINLSPGTYNVKVTDNTGKSKDARVTIEDRRPEVININLRETATNKFSWNSKLFEKGAVVSLKIVSQGLKPIIENVSDRSSYTFSTGNAKWDGVPCSIELIITARNGLSFMGVRKIETFCACKP